MKVGLLIFLVLVLALSFTVAFDQDITVLQSIRADSKQMTRCEPRKTKSIFPFQLPFKKVKTSLSLKFCDSLYNAIEDGNVKKTLFLLNFSFKRNNTKICYKYYANIEANPIFTPFTHVCQRGNIELLKLFMSVKKRVNINQSGLGGWTCLHIAIHNGNMELIEYLLSLKGIDVEQKLTESRDTALNFAVYQGNIDAVAKLLAFGARFDLSKALPAAVHSRSTNMAQFILDYYVKNNVDSDEEGEMLVSRMNGVAAVINKIEKQGNLVIVSAMNGNEEMTTLLLNNGGDVNSIDPVTLKSILHLAVYMGWSYIVELLLNNKHNICYFTDDDQYTPYDLALSMRKTNMIESLSTHGCAISERDLTPIQFRTIKRMKESLRFVL